MMARMSDENGIHEQSEPGVLGSLPRTRPQRPSRRRESTKASSGSDTSPASREQNSSSASAAAKGSAKPRARKTTAAKASTAKASTAKATAGKTSAAKTSTAQASAAKRTAPKAPPRRREPPAPKQGYEPMEEPKAGTTVHPPSGAELVESVATIFAELASVGLKAGGRVLKDALSPLRRP